MSNSSSQSRASSAKTVSNKQQKSYLIKRNKEKIKILNDKIKSWNDKIKTFNLEEEKLIQFLNKELSNSSKNIITDDLIDNIKKGLRIISPRYLSQAKIRKSSSIRSVNMLFNKIKKDINDYFNKRKDDLNTEIKIFEIKISDLKNTFSSSSSL